jgi:hypothetical protein
MLRLQWEDDCGGPTIFHDDNICLRCGLYDDGSGCSLAGSSLEEYREKYKYIVSGPPQKTVAKISDGVVRYNCNQKAKDLLYETMLQWFIEQETFSGESIMQSDAPLIEAPELLCKIAEEIFEFDAIWVDEEE